ncbi:hypothetical protein TWF788_010158 [Orbilia oligospora]|uniref:HAUS augmin-like complex subunit 6 N-terminal domain-containing protein n=1 Tax=Orbilia oligospora TaxID=2813651 RepID=A0A7C8KKP8_ORBOL|nr:hypothetical protein TWF788_010158 [Orbilia oligospora]
MKHTAEITPVALLLTNLRLLDLPVYQDLPIDDETFSLGKNKSRAFELIAHHIFDRYDPIESKSRFAGNWPIYEPAQSKNFRAAIVNWLTDLKKSGALHNAIIIRKSMFDECQGDRYEELLLFLSTMALKKVVQREHKDHTGDSIALDEALSTHPDLDTVNILNIAYQNSLRNTLQHRFVDKKKWFLASRRLEEQGRLVSEREQATAIARESRKGLGIKESDITSVWEKNWVGDQSIYKLLLPDRDDATERELWSNASFKKLLQTGTFNKPCASNGSGSTVKTMEDAVKAHESRLARWKEYNYQFLKERTGSKKSLPGKKVSFAADVGGGLGVDFNKHQNLHASAFTLQEGTQLPIPSTDDEFGKLFNSMRKELQTIRVSRRKLGTLSYASTYGEGGDEESVASDEQKDTPTPKDITEEEALKLLTSHLPTDTTSRPLPGPTTVNTGHNQTRPASMYKIPPRASTPELVQPKPSPKPSPKPRLRSPPPPPKPIEPSDDPEDSLEDTVMRDPPSPESPYEIPYIVEPSPQKLRSHRFDGEYSVDEYMVEKMIAQIATSADTPAPTRTQRLLPNPARSKEELEADPFKSRPRVALSPPFTPQPSRDDHGVSLETPRVGFQSPAFGESDYDEYEDEDESKNESPSKGRGVKYR